MQVATANACHKCYWISSGPTNTKYSDEKEGIGIFSFDAGHNLTRGRVHAPQFIMLIIHVDRLERLIGESRFFSCSRG
jgi:hypothetical protein